MTGAHYIAVRFIVLALLLVSAPPVAAGAEWEVIKAQGVPTARHEAAFVAVDNRLYLLGGRRINPVDVFDPKSKTWRAGAKSPIELHHIQGVTDGEKIYIVGAMTGGWPGEIPIDRVMIYDPEADEFSHSHEIPKERRRGGAGAVYHQGKIYLVGGIRNGHLNGYVNWFDEYDPETGEWRVLPDAPNKRDHTAAAVHKDRLYVFGGRRSGHAVGNNFGPTEPFGDVYDFKTGTWLPPTDDMVLPTPRAGNMVFAHDGVILVGGGESEFQGQAHSEVQAYHVAEKTWYTWPSLVEGRHGSGFARIGNYLYTASGSGNRGGGPELTSIERLDLRKARKAATPIATAPDEPPSVRQYDTVTLDFDGPASSENADDNPFTNYVLRVTFQSGDMAMTVRGFFAADGNAAETGADAGNVWRAHFTPPSPGAWTYEASLLQGENIAMAEDMSVGTPVALSSSTGAFTVMPATGTGPDFRGVGRGRLKADGHYLTFRDSGRVWLKGGANSPENLLGYHGFDGTYRITRAARPGDVTPDDVLHTFSPHVVDWRPGDPDWHDGAGKGIIGAMNYLAGEGMNAVYFVTMNIGGDGQDAWPYRDPDDFTRFDVSKFDQWDIVFSHMQTKGILLHIVLQETENELLLDNGDTGPMRRLYLAEMIARFAHHNGLIWNLGEENGPVSWMPEGQTDDQRRAMAAFLSAHDPYDNPILLHTHAGPEDKDHIVTPLLGNANLDGLSLQVGDRRTVHDETKKWRDLSREVGRPWVLTMDEIGMWYMGAPPDAMAGRHTSLRRHALWGHFLAGGAGVEWYFGYKFPHNDLTAEDWRSRHDLWTQTRYALDFFNAHVTMKGLEACAGGITDRPDAYCATDGDGQHIIYFPETGASTLSLDEAKSFEVMWYDPANGGALQTGSVSSVNGGDWRDAGEPPLEDGRDWVLLLRPKTQN